MTYPLSSSSSIQSNTNPSFWNLPILRFISDSAILVQIDTISFLGYLRSLYSCHLLSIFQSIIAKVNFRSINAFKLLRRKQKFLAVIYQFYRICPTPTTCLSVLFPCSLASTSFMMFLPACALLSASASPSGMFFHRVSLLLAYVQLSVFNTIHLSTCLHS